jgi:hypothetical protein
MGIKLTRKRVVGAAAVAALAVGGAVSFASATPNPSFVPLGPTPTAVALSSGGPVGTSAYKTAGLVALNATAAPIIVSCTLSDTSTPPFGLGKPVPPKAMFTAQPLAFTTGPVITNIATSTTSYIMRLDCTGGPGVLLTPGTDIIPA